jgi:hypothetical protein
MEKEEMKAKAIEILLKNFNIAGLGTDLLGILLKPALDEIVKSSENPYDDMAVAALYPVLSQALLSELDKQLAKINE